MPRSRDTVREAILCVPEVVLKRLAPLGDGRDWERVADSEWAWTRVLVRMIPENRVGGCLLGYSRGAVEPSNTADDNALVTAARRAVGRWLRVTPEPRAYAPTAGIAHSNEEKARRMESFTAMARRALKGSGEWVPPLAASAQRSPRRKQATKEGGNGPGGFRARQYFVLRCGDLPLVLVGRNSRYGRIIESSDPLASPPAQWDISATFVRASEPLGEPLEARLRALEKVAGQRAPFVAALRAVACGVTASLWKRAVIDAATRDHGFRSNGKPRRPKIAGKKLGEALLPPVPLISRKKVGDWYVADRRS